MSRNKYGNRFNGGEKDFEDLEEVEELEEFLDEVIPEPEVKMWVDEYASQDSSDPLNKPSKVRITNCRRLNARSGPGEDFDVIGSLLRNDVVIVKDASHDAMWLQVELRDSLAWIMAKYSERVG
jgi:hypothetical protein